MDLSCSGSGPVLGSCGHSNELSDSTKDKEFLGQILGHRSDHQRFRKDSVPWSKLFV